METIEPSIEVVADDTLPSALITAASNSSASIVLLPVRYDENGSPQFAGATPTVEKLLREAGLVSETLPAEGARFREDRGIDWVAPTLFVTFAMYSSNPNAVALALNVLGSYIHEFFRGREKTTSVKLDVLCFRGFGLGLRRVKYKGPVEGLKNLDKTVKETMESRDD